MWGTYGTFGEQGTLNDAVDVKLNWVCHVTFEALYPPNWDSVSLIVRRYQEIPRNSCFRALNSLFDLQAERQICARRLSDTLLNALPLH